MKKELTLLVVDHLTETSMIIAKLARSIAEDQVATDSALSSDFSAQLHLEREAYTAEIRGTKLQVAEEKLRADQLLQRLREKDKSLAKAEISLARLKKLNKGNKKSR
jgi:hypothetical protein